MKIGRITFAILASFSLLVFIGCGSKSKIPKCPVCNGSMVERRNSKTGELFYGCASFPQCKGTISQKPKPWIPSVDNPSTNSFALPVANNTATTPPSSNAGPVYVLNIRSGIRHVPNCKWLKDANPNNLSVCGATDGKPCPECQKNAESNPLDYMINIKSGIRHRSSCRWLKKANKRNLRRCGKHVGRPCPECGG